jgi:signal transduction histidine kinase
MAESEQATDKLPAAVDPVFSVQAFFAEVPVAFAIAHVDGRCLAVNRAFRELFGAAPPPGYNVFKDELVIEQGLLPYVQRAFRGESVVVPAFWYDAGKADAATEAQRVAIDSTMGDPPAKLSRSPSALSLRAIEVAMTPLPDRDGTVRHIALCYKDVTPHHEPVRPIDEQHLRVQEANRLKSEFLAAMSYELRTPLNTIIGFAELIFYGRVEPESPEHHEFLGDILASSKQLLRMLNNVMDLAHVEAGKLELCPEPVVVESAIAEVAAVLRTQSLQKRIRIEVEADRSLEIVVVDPTRFKQVLYNYLSNALKFTGEGGRIIVRTAPEGPEEDELFRVEVEDTGAGIAPEQLARLFVEIAQPDPGTEKRSGSGLGLVLTRRIVEAQGGSVGVRSRLGEGSVFHAILPRRIPASRAR